MKNKQNVLFLAIWGILFLFATETYGNGCSINKFRQISETEIDSAKKKIQNIYDKIFFTIGLETGKPELVFGETDSENGVYYSPANHKIVFEPKVIRLLLNQKSLDENVAFLLSHEAGHCFLSTQGISDTETDADKISLMLCYAMGYNLTEEVFQFLNKIHQASYVERLEHFKKNSSEMRYWGFLLIAANSLCFLKQYEAAAICYEQIADKYPVLPFFNNTAVNYAMSIHDVNGKEFWLPYQIMAFTPIPIFERNLHFSLLSKEKIIEQAQKYFSKASQIGENNISVLFNRACFHIHRTENEKAASVMEQLRRFSNKFSDFQKADFLQLEAILFYKNSPLDCKQRLEEAKKILGNRRYVLFEYNNSLLTGSSPEVVNMLNNSFEELSSQAYFLPELSDEINVSFKEENNTVQIKININDKIFMFNIQKKEIQSNFYTAYPFLDKNNIDFFCLSSSFIPLNSNFEILFYIKN